MPYDLGNSVVPYVVGVVALDQTEKCDDVASPASKQAGAISVDLGVVAFNQPMDDPVGIWNFQEVRLRSVLFWPRSPLAFRAKGGKSGDGVGRTLPGLWIFFSKPCKSTACIILQEGKP
jgi:hypothetical protein